jgi:phosphoribosyl-ATP pyrophosphohydrolase/phosphoribosyl-AMP cyclohydrolase
VLDLEQLNFEKGNGLVVVVAQDARSGALLMVAFADREALERTVATGEMHYRSRSRGLWHKGATSGNVQRVVSLTPDCDGDAVLARVSPAGPACHTGSVSCFGEAGLAVDALGELDATIARRARGVPPQRQDAPGVADDQDRERAPETTPPLLKPPASPHDAAIGAPAGAAPTPKPSYTARLLADRNLRLKKLGEEAAELVLACADEDAARSAEEGADIVYHTLVALRAVGVTLDDLRHVLAGRVK